MLLKYKAVFNFKFKQRKFKAEVVFKQPKNDLDLLVL